MADNFLRTFGDSAIKQDVVGLIEILTARETWFLNNLEKRTAISTVHQTQTDTLATAASIAVGEGADYVINTSTTPTLVANVVQHCAFPFAVTHAQQLVQHYVGENELVRQTTKGLMNWGNGVEFDLVRSTLVSGISGTTPKMSGIIEAVSKSTNHTSHSSGTALSASIIHGLMKDAWDNSNGNDATDLFVGSFLRNVIDGFTQKTNNLVQVPATTLHNLVEFFQTSFGRIGLHTHRYVQQAGDSTGRVLAVSPETLKIAYLRRPYVDTELARSGPYDKRAVVGDLTMEVSNQDNNWYADGFDID